MKKHGRGLLLKLAAFVFAVYIAVTLITQVVQIKSGNAQLALLKAQVADQQKDNARTKQLLSENYDQFVESVARDDLGYAKPSERIYVDASGS